MRAKRATLLQRDRQVRASASPREKAPKPRVPKIRYAKDASGEWYYTLVGANGEPMLRSTEGYTTASSARRGWRDAVEAICKLTV